MLFWRISTITDFQCKKRTVFRVGNGRFIVLQAQERAVYYHILTICKHFSPFPYTLIFKNAPPVEYFPTRLYSPSNSRFSTVLCMFLKIKNLWFWRKITDETTDRKRDFVRQKHWHYWLKAMLLHCNKADITTWKCRYCRTISALLAWRCGFIAG